MFERLIEASVSWFVVFFWVSADCKGKYKQRSKNGTRRQVLTEDFEYKITSSRNLSIKNRLRDRFFSSKSRQVARQCFQNQILVRNAKQGQREKTGPVTVFKTGQVAEARACPLWKPVSGHVFSLWPCFPFLSKIWFWKHCLATCLDFELKNLSLSLFFIDRLKDVWKHMHKDAFRRWFLTLADFQVRKSARLKQARRCHALAIDCNW